MKRRTLLAAPAVLGLSRRVLAADRIKVGMLKPNIVTAIYWIAVRTGAFQKNGLDVVENPFPSGQTAAGIEQLMRGSLDFYLGASGEVAHANSRYVEAGKPPPLALIEGGIAGGSFFVLRSDLRDKTLDDLRGQPLRIAISNPSSYHLILLRAFLRDRGMTTDDLKWRFLTVGGPEMLPAMVSHQLDGFLHDALTTTLALRANTGFVFMASDRGDMGAKAKQLPGTGVCSNRAFLKSNPDAAKRFAQSLRDASAAYAAAPKADMVAIMSEWSRQDLAVVDDMYERFDPRVGLTRQAAQTWWDILGAAMLARGEITEKLTIDDVFDLGYMRQDFMNAIGKIDDFARHVRSADRRLRWRRLWRGAAGIMVVLLAWQVMSSALDLELLLPPPLTVLRNTLRILAVSDTRWLYGPNIYVHLWHSFLRAMAGFGGAAIIAIPLGLVLGRIVTLREFILPSIKGVYPIPGIAWIPLAILWFGLGDVAVIFVVFATTFFPMFFSTEAGARQISPVVLDAARCFGARGATLFFRVVLPATVPFIITGLRISLGGAWRMIVAGEMLASQDGIGYFLMESRFQFKAVDLMTAMILVAIVGYATEKIIVDTIEKRTLEKWEVQPL